MNGRRGASLVLILSVVILAVWNAGICQEVPWMFQPTNQIHSLSNSYCELQDYGYNYYHDGIDVIKATGGVPTYSSTDGYMTHEAFGTMYGGLMIGYSYTAGDSGWLYWHLPSNTFQFNVGDFIQEGDYIGDIAYWSVYDFHHVHFNKVNGEGGIPWSWYASTGNPLEHLNPNTDPQYPMIHNALGSELLAFCVDNTSNYLSPNQLQGNVDVIAKIGDLCRNDYWEVAPFKIEYTITGNAIYDHFFSVVFSGDLPGSNTITTVYKDDYTCNSAGNYTDRDFFFVLTNHDDDEIIEYSDRDGYWRTSGYPGGDYTIIVDAYDVWGNLTQDSMQVTVLPTAALDVTVTLTPTGSTQLPSTGGTIPYTVEIQNNENHSVSFDGWIEMTYPIGDVVEVLHRELFLSAGGTITRQVTMTIAGSEPDGQYYYEGKVGYHPHNDWSSSGFNITKGIDGLAEGEWIQETKLDGWDESIVSITEDRKSSEMPVTIYPNPFNPTTEITFTVAEQTYVNLAVYDVSGRQVDELIADRKTSGTHRVVFNASTLPSGVYFYRLLAGDETASGKLLFLK
jgi:hypothetical protein